MCGLLLCASVLIFPPVAKSALVVVSENGEIVWNVLSVTDFKPQRESLKVTSVTKNETPSQEAVISFVREDGKTQLHVSNKGESKSTDVTGYKDEIIVIEETSPAKKLTILMQEEDFVIKQDQISAVTNFPITVNAKNKELSVLTPSGLRYIKVLPSDVLDNAYKADIIDTVLESAKLIEGVKGELEYQLSGEKNINLFNVMTINAPVNVSVSAISGEVINVEKPQWLRIFGFLFS